MEKKKPVWKEKKFLLIAALGAVGLILLLLGGNGVGRSTKETSGSAASAQGASREELEKYTERLKKEIRELCAEVDGVSDVSVAVTLESGFEYVYATDSKSGSGSSGNESQIKYITIGSGASEGTVYITEKMPKIGGVGVVCRGGSDPAVVRRLTLLISAAYNIGANKIYITGT